MRESIQVPTFRDGSTRAAMARAGYVVFPELAAPQLPALRSVYADMLAAMPVTDPYFRYPMTGTNCIGDLALRQQVLAAVAAIIAPQLDALLEDFRVVGAGFRVKQVGAESALPLHQDPTQVDEDRHWLMNVIVPIVDTDPENGALQIVPGSHMIMPKLRSLDLEDRAETWNLHEVIAPLVKTVCLRAGDAIFYFQSLLHGSGPNRTGDARPVVLGTIVARQAPVTVYFRAPEQPTMFECYEVPDDYFNRMEDFDRDHKLRPQVGRRIADVPDPYPLTAAEVAAAFRALAARSLD